MLILQLIVVQALTFLALVLFLKKMLYSHFAKAMKRLELSYQSAEKRRMELEEKLQAAQEQMERQAQENEERIASIRKEAEMEAEELKSQALAEVRQEEQKILEAARAKETEWRHDLENQVTEKAIRLGGDAVRYLLAAHLDQVVHHQLVGDFIHEMENLDAKRLNGHSREAQAVVPYDLEGPEKVKLEQVLEKKLKRKIAITIETDRSLIAGMILKFENVILDGSLKSKLKEALGYVRKGEKHV